MGRTVSNGPGYALDDDEFDPQIDDFVAKDRNYLHFDLPLNEEERSAFKADAKSVCASPHWPLLGYVTTERRIRKNSDGNVEMTKKERPIKFASHRDAATLEYYGRDLGEAYEKLLATTGFATSILAYRSGIGNNVDHAKTLFDEIRLRGDCTAIALDVTGFFDSIQHQNLKRELCRVRGKAKLSNTDFSVYKRMTKFSWVDSTEARERLSFRYGRGGRICTGPEFRRLLRDEQPKLVRTNSLSFGIPQGTPLSGLYANISMIGFDCEMSKEIQALGGSYRRYSDDIAIVIPTSSGPAIAVEIVEKALAEIGLSLSKGKTEISNFSRSGKELVATKPFQYLGFTFDGKRTLVRQSSLSRYYTKMHLGVRAKVHAAKRLGVAPHEIFMRELFRKYTHFGQHRNFPRYVYRAAAKNDAPEMRAQLNRHMLIFKRMVKRAVDQIY